LLEQLVDQRSLAMIDVCDDRDISKLLVQWSSNSISKARRTTGRSARQYGLGLVLCAAGFTGRLWRYLDIVEMDWAAKPGDG